MARLTTVIATACILVGSTALASERSLVRLEAEVLSVGPLEKGGREPLPLVLPLLVKAGSSTEIAVEKGADGTSQVVLQKPADSQEVAMQFEWSNPVTPPGRLILRTRLKVKAVSKGGALNMIFRSSDGERPIPRLQISNGGSLALVSHTGDVYRFEAKLPEDQFSDLVLQVDYLRREAILQVDGQTLGEPVAIDRGRPVTHLTISASDPTRARWTAFSSIVVTEEP